MRAARLEAGLSQAQLGAPHFTRAYVSAIELGKVRPAMKSLEFLAARVGKPVAHFVIDEVEEAASKARKLLLVEIGTLLTRSNARQALAKIDEARPQMTEVRERAQLQVMAGTAHNFLIDGPRALEALAVAERLAVALEDVGLKRAIRYQTAIAHRATGDPARSLDLLRALAAEIEAASPPDRPLLMKVFKDLGAASLSR
ncbi:MAG: helix-turn-helix transcriptional regulator, partial [Chloroflexi bacterium]|nr:helix-turn-helix transcriptional regulator [Chloroflexota bacterium]